MSPELKAYEQDFIKARHLGLGSKDNNLIQLRNNLLRQNSHALEQLTRRKLLGSSDTGSNNQPNKTSGPN